MAAQAALIAETIAGMKRAISGHQYSSDSDDSLQPLTNRGNKLKRKAQYVQKGQLDRPSGPKTYKKKIEHAGYERYIINRNPKRYDEDGDELEDDETDDQADADAAARNPYHDVRIEEILAPLTSAADLPKHPSLSVPYRLSTLTNMVQQAREMLHKERRILSSVKYLLTQLRGDKTWIPCGDLNSEIDDVIFDTSSIFQEASKIGTRLDQANLVSQNPSNGGENLQPEEQMISKDEPNIQPNISSDTPLRRLSDAASSSKIDGNPDTDSVDPTQIATSMHASEELTNSKGDAKMANVTDEDVHIVKITSPIRLSSPNPKGKDEDTRKDISPISDPDRSSSTVDSASLSLRQAQKEADVTQSTDYSQRRDKSDLAPPSNEQNTVPFDGAVSASGVGLEKSEDTIGRGEEDALLIEPRRMRTRAQAQAASEKTTSSRTRSISSASWVPPVTHPLFLMPESARPNRDFGLPPVEAEEIRRMVMLYVQKQEEVCRGAERLYIGLLRADRMRKTVFKWCKAEGHIGEMSDGEDWYDKEEWGLDEDLRKGHDDEEDDAATQVKRTRGRRA